MSVWGFGNNIGYFQFHILLKLFEKYFFDKRLNCYLLQDYIPVSQTKSTDMHTHELCAICTGDQVKMSLLVSGKYFNDQIIL